MIVADTNLVAELCFRSARLAQVERIRKLDRVWIVPPLFRSEFLSVLGKYLRRGEMTRDQAIRTYRRACSSVSVIDDANHAADVLKLLAGGSCTSYDLEFVALAQRHGVPLVTADVEIIAAFPDVACSFDQFEESY